MSKFYLLDTNAAIFYLNGDQAVKEVIDSADAVFLSSIVLGELYFGAEHSGRVAKNIAQIEQFISGRTLLFSDKETARWYARVLNGLTRKGRPIPDNDVWIAATAFQHNLTVLTRDSHFNEVDNLPIEGW
jgi:tRNA(fMet)-specific endonuclease VapC